MEVDNCFHLSWLHDVHCLLIVYQLFWNLKLFDSTVRLNLEFILPLLIWLTFSIKTNLVYWSSLPFFLVVFNYIHSANPHFIRAISSHYTRYPCNLIFIIRFIIFFLQCTSKQQIVLYYNFSRGIRNLMIWPKEKRNVLHSAFRSLTWLSCTITSLYTTWYTLFCWFIGKFSPI